MATSTAVKRKYNEKSYDRLEITCKKGKKDIYKALAEKQGKSLNCLVNELLERELNAKID